MLPTQWQLDNHKYPHTDKNTEFEKMVLRFYGFPEDYLPDADEAQEMLSAYMDETSEDGDLHTIR